MTGHILKEGISVLFSRAAVYLYFHKQCAEVPLPPPRSACNITPNSWEKKRRCGALGRTAGQREQDVKATPNAWNGFPVDAIQEKSPQESPVLSLLRLSGLVYGKSSVPSILNQILEFLVNWDVRGLIWHSLSGPWCLQHCARTPQDDPLGTSTSRPPGFCHA